jgi:hypothetical protein
MTSPFQKLAISLGHMPSDMINKPKKRTQDRSILHANLWAHICKKSPGKRIMVALYPIVIDDNWSTLDFLLGLSNFAMELKHLL